MTEVQKLIESVDASERPAAIDWERIIELLAEWLPVIIDCFTSRSAFLDSRATITWPVRNRFRRLLIQEAREEGWRVRPRQLRRLADNLVDKYEALDDAAAAALYVEASASAGPFSECCSES